MIKGNVKFANNIIQEGIFKGYGVRFYMGINKSVYEVYSPEQYFDGEPRVMVRVDGSVNELAVNENDIAEKCSDLVVGEALHSIRVCTNLGIKCEDKVPEIEYLNTLPRALVGDEDFVSMLEGGLLQEAKEAKNEMTSKTEQEVFDHNVKQFITRNLNERVADIQDDKTFGRN